jgi:hypothetical protein
MLYHIFNLSLNIFTYILNILPYVGFGFCLNRLYSLYTDYKREKNIKKVVIKEIYVSLFDTVYKQFGENINDLDKLLKQTSNNKLSLDDFDKLKRITMLTMEVSKHHNKKYKIIINNNKLTVSLLDSSYMENKELNELLGLLDLKIISNANSDVLTLEQNQNNEKNE